MSSYLLAHGGVTIVADSDGKTYVLPGMPITVHAAEQAASSSALHNDLDIIYAPGIASTSQVATAPLLTDAETVYGAALVPGTKTLAPIRLDDTDAFFAPSIAAIAATRTLAPGLYTDPDTLYPLVRTRDAVSCGRCSSATTAQVATRASSWLTVRAGRSMGQSFDWLVPAEAEVLGARLTDRPAALPGARAHCISVGRQRSSAGA